MKTVKFNLKNNTVVDMTIDEVARWACLIEGVEQVDKFCKNTDQDDNDDWIKPLAFQKYIDERFHSMKHDLTVEALMGRL
jgi:hypothetical protein